MKVNSRGLTFCYSCSLGRSWPSVRILADGSVTVNDKPADEWLKSTRARDARAWLRSNVASILWSEFFVLRGCFDGAYCAPSSWSR